VKGIYVVGKKLAKNGHKMAKLKGCLFLGHQSLVELFVLEKYFSCFLDVGPTW
jgi:hypothetical protein